MTFNILSSALSNNPFEFESLYRDDSIMCQNVKLLFDLACSIMNPKSELKEKVVKVKHFFPNEQILREDDILRYSDWLATQKKVLRPERLKQLRDMPVCDLMAIYDKGNRDCVCTELALAQLDRSSTLRKFYKYSGSTDVEEKVKIIQTEGEEKFLVYALTDLIFRRILKVFYEFLFYNKFLDARNVSLSDTQKKRAYDIMQRLIVSTEITEGKEIFEYNENEREWINDFFDNYNKDNTDAHKLDVIIRMITENQIDVATLEEIGRSFYKKVEDLLYKDSFNFDYFPKNHTHQDEGDFVTLVIYNKHRISDVKTLFELDARNRIIQFSVANHQDLNVQLIQVHLPAGDGFEQDRLNSIKKLVENMDRKLAHTYINGDFNENLDPNRGLLKYLSENGCSIGTSEIERLKKCTCDKMRSALQYQINKMRKPDKSTKDAILGFGKYIKNEEYNILYQRISDHKAIIAGIFL